MGDKQEAGRSMGKKNSIGIPVFVLGAVGALCFCATSCEVYSTKGRESCVTEWTDETDGVSEAGKVDVFGSCINGVANYQEQISLGEARWPGRGKGTCRATSVDFIQVVDSYETTPLNPQAHAFEKARLDGKGLGSKVETGNEEVSSVTMLSENEWTSRNHEGRVSRCHRVLDGEEP